MLAEAFSAVSVKKLVNLTYNHEKKGVIGNIIDYSN